MSFTKSFSFRITPASFLVKRDDVSMLVPSMVLSTIMVCAIITFAPWLVPVVMADAQRSAL